MNSIAESVISSGEELPPKPSTAPPLEVKEVTELDLTDSPAPTSEPFREVTELPLDGGTAQPGETGEPTANYETTTPPPQPPKGRGRHPKGCVCGRCNQSKGTSSPSFQDLQTAQPVERDCKTEAEGLFDLATNVLASAIGPEWLQRSPEERKMVTDALAAYLKTRPQGDIPPGVMLCFVSAIYIAPRCREENTKTKLKAFWNWCQDAWTWFSIKFLSA